MICSPDSGTQQLFSTGVDSGNSGRPQSLRWIFLLVLAFSALSAITAQEYTIQIRPSAEEPLQYAVFDVMQDADGLLWLATDGGTIRYDGMELIALPDTARSRTFVLHQVADGSIYAGGADGNLFRIGEGSMERINLPDTGMADISAIAGNGDTLWVGTRGNGLYRFSGGSWVRFGKNEGIADNFIYSLETDSLGRLWVAHDRGIDILDRNMNLLKHLTGANGLPDHIVLRLRKGAEGRFWFGTHDGGFGWIDAQFKVHTAGSLPWTHGAVSDVLPLSGGGAWIITSGSGMMEWRDGTLKSVAIADDKTLNSPICLHEDLEGNIWIGGRSPGLAMVNRRLALVPSSVYPQVSGITAIHAGRSKAVWFATAEGLFSYHPEKGDTEVIRKHPGAVRTGLDLVISIQEMEDGMLWLGTFGQGLVGYQMESGRTIRVTERDGLINDNVLSLSAMNGKLWLATLGGAAVMTIRPGPLNVRSLVFQDYDDQHGLGANYIYGVFTDSKGREWFATDGRGLTVLDGETFTTYGPAEGLTSEVVYAVAEAPQGDIWVSTYTGLFVFDGQRFEEFGETYGIRDKHIEAIACDREGFLIAAHHRGIDLINTYTREVLYLGGESGKAHPEPGLNVISGDQDGNIWIGTQEGIIRYTPLPASLQHHPLLRLNSIRVFLQDAPDSERNVFRHADNHISFRYTGLWYQDPARVAYRHTLEGYDIDWVSTREQVAIYPSLKPGRYTFRVQASINGNFSNGNEVTYTFRIRPPLWQNPIIIILAVLLFAGLIFWYIKAREKRIHKVQALEQQRVEFQFQTLRSQVNPHFLFNSFNTLMQMIEEDKKKAAAYVQTLSDFFRNILRYREVEVIGLDEEFKVLQGYYFLQQQRYGNKFSLEVRVDNAGEYVVPPLTLQLLVENALKHNVITSAKPLLVEIFAEGECLIVRNNLQLKQEPEQSTRVGLANIGRRYSLLSQRDVTIEEKDGYFIVKLPLVKQSV